VAIISPSLQPGTREAPVNGANTTADSHNGRNGCTGIYTIYENYTTQKAPNPGMIQSIQDTQ